MVCADDVRKKAAGINSKLGSKLEIPDSELAATYEACVGLLKQVGGAGRMWVGMRMGRVRWKPPIRRVWACSNR